MIAGFPLNVTAVKFLASALESITDCFQPAFGVIAFVVTGGEVPSEFDAVIVKV